MSSNSKKTSEKTVAKPVKVNFISDIQDGKVTQQYQLQLPLYSQPIVIFETEIDDVISQLTLLRDAINSPKSKT